MTREEHCCWTKWRFARERRPPGECICVGVGEGQVGLPYRIQIQIQNRANQVPDFQSGAYNVDFIIGDVAGMMTTTT